jgi:hypothetical protein
MVITLILVVLASASRRSQCSACSGVMSSTGMSPKKGSRWVRIVER